MATLGAIFPNKNFKSFSKGVKFKSNPKTLLLLFDLLSTGNLGKTGSAAKLSVMAARCFLMWPPKACPRANSRPQMEHSCIFGFVDKLKNLAASSFNFSPINLGLLWLARWPPRAWNDGNVRLQVLHSKIPLFKCFLGSFSRLWESSIRHLAMSMLSPFSLILFMAMLIERVMWANEFFFFFFFWRNSKWVEMYCMSKKPASLAYIYRRWVLNLDLSFFDFH